MDLPPDGHLSAERVLRTRVLLSGGRILRRRRLSTPPADRDCRVVGESRLYVFPPPRAGAVAALQVELRVCGAQLLARRQGRFRPLPQHAAPAPGRQGLREPLSRRHGKDGLCEARPPGDHRELRGGGNRLPPGRGEPVRPAGRFGRPGGRSGRPDDLLAPRGAVHIGDGPPRRTGPPGDRDLLLQRFRRLGGRQAGPVGPDGAHAPPGAPRLHRPGPQGGHVLGHCLQAQVPARSAGEREDRRPRAVDPQAEGAEPGPVRGDPPEHAGPPPVPQRAQAPADPLPGDPPGGRGRPRFVAGKERLDPPGIRGGLQGRPARRGRARGTEARVSLVVQELVEGPVAIERCRRATKPTAMGEFLVVGVAQVPPRPGRHGHLVSLVALYQQAKPPRTYQPRDHTHTHTHTHTQGPQGESAQSSLVETIGGILSKTLAKIFLEYPVQHPRRCHREHIRVLVVDGVKQEIELLYE
mmetsp:Transcript_7071/g.14440  ORF Transcript_7071/g.14440 Transcript_7071/m.14440 type:complete len:468 (-) Transcript_7071:13-1416(-)